MNIQLVPAIEEDRAFFRKSHHLAYRPIIESMFGWDEGFQDNRADIDFDERNPHIIECDEIRSGVLGWQDRPDYIWFGPLFILPEFQNRGIGTFLTKQFMGEADSKGLALRLQTLKLNMGAKRLYERLGFKVLSSSEIHWQMEYMKVRRG